MKMKRKRKKMSDKESVQEKEQDHKKSDQNTDKEQETQGEAPQYKSDESTEKGELEEINNRYLRLYSEFENYRKRTAKEKLDVINSASAEVMSDLLSVLDDFERAIKANEEVEDAEGLKEGFLLIYNKLMKTLKNKGLEEMDAEGQPFDTDLHEALTNIPAPNDDLKGKVVEVIEKGYYLNDKVLRYAKVVVGQ